MRWLWRNIIKTRWLYQAWMLNMVVSKRYGALVYILASFLLFSVYIKLTLSILKSSSTLQSGLDLLHSTHIGKYASIPLGVFVIFVPFYFLFRKPSNIALDHIQNHGDLATEALQDVKDKLERLNHA
ncbi:MAG: hypothetical protein COB08_006440 [Rhodobacteraceae bacterium]|nr:hypothetical protein [Paracoccaceae bacterium]